MKLYIKPEILIEEIEEEHLLGSSLASDCNCKGNDNFQCHCTCGHKCTSLDGNGAHRCDNLAKAYNLDNDFLLDDEY